MKNAENMSKNTQTLPVIGGKYLHKEKKTIETVIYLGKVKINGVWQDSVVYKGIDYKTGEPCVFTRTLEDFCENFEIFENKKREPSLIERKLLSYGFKVIGANRQGVNLFVKSIGLRTTLHAQSYNDDLNKVKIMGRYGWAISENIDDLEEIIKENTI